MSVFDHDAIRHGLRQAWHDSEPGSATAHEERGYILRNDQGELIVERWPRGAQNEIVVPDHPAGRRGGLPVIATFHTHPNLGAEYEQEPSQTDIRAVRDDPDLGHTEFEGEYVIATELLYRIDRSGTVEVIGETTHVLWVPPDSSPT